MQKLWTGAITFGVFTVPAALFPAIKDHAEIKLSTAPAAAPLRAPAPTLTTAAPLPAAAPASPIEPAPFEYEFAAGSRIQITPAELATLKGTPSRDLALIAFVPREQMANVLLLDKPYYLAPEPHGHSGFACLVAALQKTESAGLGYLTLKTKTRLAAVIEQDGQLIVETINWSTQLAPPPSAQTLTAAPGDVAAAAAQIRKLKAPFNHASWADPYQSRLRAFIDERVVAAQRHQTATRRRPIGATLPARVRGKRH